MAAIMGGVVRMLPVDGSDGCRVDDWGVRVGISGNYAASQCGSQISIVGGISIVLGL